MSCNALITSVMRKGNRGGFAHHAFAFSLPVPELWVTKPCTLCKGGTRILHCAIKRFLRERKCYFNGLEYVGAMRKRSLQPQKRKPHQKRSSSLLESSVASVPRKGERGVRVACFEP